MIHNHKISERLTLHIPEDFSRIPMPGLNAWLTALRSGNYAQGPDFLNQDGKYCCLGVLCEVQQRPKIVHPRVLGDRLSYDDSSTVLSRVNPLYRWLGDSGAFPRMVQATLTNELSIGEKQTVAAPDLTVLNDNLIPFADIAAVIELIWVEQEGPGQ